MKSMCLSAQLTACLAATFSASHSQSRLLPRRTLTSPFEMQQMFLASGLLMEMSAFSTCLLKRSSSPTPESSSVADAMTIAHQHKFGRVKSAEGRAEEVKE